MYALWPFKIKFADRCPRWLDYFTFSFLFNPLLSWLSAEDLACYFTEKAEATTRELSQTSFTTCIPSKCPSLLLPCALTDELSRFLPEASLWTCALDPHPRLFKDIASEVLPSPYTSAFHPVPVRSYQHRQMLLLLSFPDSTSPASCCLISLIILEAKLERVLYIRRLQFCPTLLKLSNKPSHHDSCRTKSSGVVSVPSLLGFAAALEPWVLPPPWNGFCMDFAFPLTLLIFFLGLLF